MYTWARSIHSSLGALASARTKLCILESKFNYKLLTKRHNVICAQLKIDTTKKRNNS